MQFNLHHGQVRFSSIQTGSKPIFRNKSPKKMLMVRNIRRGDEAYTYRADKLGNISVEIHQHIDAMVGLGYPIYAGDGERPVEKDRDLLYPNLDMDSPYWQRINEGKNLRRD